MITQSGEDLVSIGGKIGVNVPAGAGNTAVKNSSGRLARVVILVAGTGAGNVQFIDGVNRADGQLIAAIPATISVPSSGGALVFDVPFQYGLTVVNVANGPQLNVVV